MKNIYIFIFLISFSFAFAQAPDISWLKNYGGSSSDYATTAIQTSDGGYIVAGSTYSVDGDVTINYGDQDVWLLKLDASGDLEWQKSYGGSGDDYPEGIVEVVGEGFVIGGYTDSNDGDVSGNHGGYDMWVFKIDTSGNLIWQNALGGTLNDFAGQITKTVDGGFILAGSSWSNNGDLTFYQYKGNMDLWLVKIDGSGNLVWQKSYGGSISENANNIKPTLDGNFIVCGYTTSNSDDGDVSVNKGNSDFWILKINSTGDLLWEKTFGGALTERAFDILATSDGGYIAMGDTTSYDGDVSYKLGVRSYWVIKMDGSGNLIWEKTYGGSMEDQGYSITSDPSGGYVLIGITDSPTYSGDVSTRIGGDDIWVIKIDDTGNLLWEKTYGGTQYDESFTIITTNDNNFLMCGSSRSSDGDMVSNSGYSDLWVAKLDNSSLSLSELNKSEFTIYPNPAKNYFYLKSNESVLTEVYNISGQKVLSGIINSQNPMDISQLSKGMYTLKINSSSGESIFKKLIVNN